MNPFWSKDIDFIGLFSLGHFFYLTVFLICLLGLFLFRHQIPRNSKKWRKAILLISLSQQFLLYFWYWQEMAFPLDEALPLHISRISSLLGIFFLFTSNLKIMDIMGYFSSFAYLSFLVPARIHPPYHALGISYLVNHVITILLPLFAHYAYNWNPSKQAHKKAFWAFSIYLFIVVLVNTLVKGNYFYLMERPFKFLNSLPRSIYLVICLIGTYLLFRVYQWLFNKITQDKNIS